MTTLVAGILTVYRDVYRGIYSPMETVLIRPKRLKLFSKILTKNSSVFLFLVSPFHSFFFPFSRHFNSFHIFFWILGIYFLFSSSVMGHKIFNSSYLFLLFLSIHWSFLSSFYSLCSARLFFILSLSRNSLP